jgi:hypothetical protein
MPLFTSSSGFQIYGGSFIDIEGDLNIHNMQPMTRPNSDPLAALGFGLTEDSNLQPSGIGWNQSTNLEPVVAAISPHRTLLPVGS